MPVLLAGDVNTILGTNKSDSILVHTTMTPDEIPADYFSCYEPAGHPMFTEYRRTRFYTFLRNCGMVDIAANTAHTAYFRINSRCGGRMWKSIVSLSRLSFTDENKLAVCGLMVYSQTKLFSN
jgi:hypothetical protein